MSHKYTNTACVKPNPQCHPSNIFLLQCSSYEQWTSSTHGRNLGRILETTLSLATLNLSPLEWISIKMFPSSHLTHLTTSYSTYFIFNFYWNIVDLQCCVSFRCTAKLFSYTHIYSFLYWYIYIFFFRFFSIIGYYKILSRVPCALQ